jgi:hypothetical protein
LGFISGCATPSVYDKPKNCEKVSAMIQRMDIGARCGDMTAFCGNYLIHEGYKTKAIIKKCEEKPGATHIYLEWSKNGTTGETLNVYC